MKRRERQALEAGYNSLYGLALAALPGEACGLIEWDGRKMRFINCRNAAADPTTSWLIDPAEQAHHLAIIDTFGTEFWGVYHSHPNSGAEPSDRDRAFASQLTINWVIIGMVPLDPRDDFDVYVGRPGT